MTEFCPKHIRETDYWSVRSFLSVLGKTITDKMYLKIWGYKTIAFEAIHALAERLNCLNASVLSINKMEEDSKDCKGSSNSIVIVK